ncbi:MAG: phosphonate ABC transporter, permease protein PhnE [Candidatus Rokubacteria bacterium]|nr:phosphonate ABC transporter, permease protein PhnE [Candidatus Rokubacteria bacterium]
MPVDAARAPERASWSGWLAGAGIAALVLWSWHGTQIDVAALLGPDGRSQLAAYVAKLFPPDLSARTVADATWGAAETFAISLVGSVLAVCLAFPLSVLATRTILYRGILYEGQRPGSAARSLRVALYGVTKGLLAVLRTIPEIVWALVFVFIVGLGPFPGVLALGVHTGGVLGKLFAEVLEDVDPRPLEALQTTGASRLTILLYGILPQALPQFVSYALYRWEVSIRAAAIMGFVGAGGLGQRIHVAISLFQEHELLTLILAVYAMVTLVDVLSAYLRARLL